MGKFSLQIILTDVGYCLRCTRETSFFAVPTPQKSNGAKVERELFCFFFFFPRQNISTEDAFFCSPPAPSIFVPKAYSGYIRGLSVLKQRSSPTVGGGGVGPSNARRALRERRFSDTDGESGPRCRNAARWRVGGGWRLLTSRLSLLFFFPPPPRDEESRAIFSSCWEPSSPPPSEESPVGGI